MPILTKIMSFGIALVFTTGAAFAASDEGFYGGVGLSYGTMKASLNEAPGVVSSSDNYSTVTVIGGYRKQMNKRFWATELQLEFPINDELAFAGAPCSTVAIGPYGCEVDALIRLRGVLGGEIGNGFELYGAAGLVFVKGAGATSPGTTDSVTTGGISFGIGLQKAFTPSLKLRGEINHDVAKIVIDQATGVLNPPGCCGINFVQTSLQVSLIKSF
jgi:outer membrane protein with beta-barrel domain